MPAKQKVKAIISVILGILTSIITDFLFSFIGPIGGFVFYSKIIGVIFGSFLAGLLFKRRGWLLGVIVSISHIVYVLGILSYPHSNLIDKSMEIDWLSLMPIAIVMLTVGVLFGYFGEKSAVIRGSVKRKITEE
jgi:hypothetical protein